MTKMKSKQLCAILLRLLAFGATFSATIVMVTSHESTRFFTVRVNAKYYNMPAFKYFVIVNAIASAYALIAIILTYAKSSFWRFYLITDLVITLVLTSGISAALAIGQLGKDGNSHTGWLPLCGQVPKFCDHVTGALISGFVGVVFYVLLLLLYSFHTAVGPFFGVTV